MEPDKSTLFLLNPHYIPYFYLKINEQISHFNYKAENFNRVLNLEALNLVTERAIMLGLFLSTYKKLE